MTLKLLSILLAGLVSVSAIGSNVSLLGLTATDGAQLA